jgi:hypothetical protein
MIHDPTVKGEIEKEWTTIAYLTNYNRSYVVGSAGGAAYINETPPETFYNLPLVLAYAALDDVLAQFIVEGVFRCLKKNGNCFNLGDKMDSAKEAISWVNFDLVKEGREARNDLAHESKLVEKHRCLKYIQAVEDELKKWGVIS